MRIQYCYLTHGAYAILLIILEVIFPALVDTALHDSHPDLKFSRRSIAKGGMAPMQNVVATHNSLPSQRSDLPESPVSARLSRLLAATEIHHALETSTTERRLLSFFNHEPQSVVGGFYICLA
jgi:hypothetical protein